jgi:hypothetical protein
VRGWCAAGLTLLAGGLAADPVRAQDPCTATAVGYVEFPASGPYRDSGRPFPAAGGGSYAIDLDSRVEIRIDADCLARAIRARNGFEQENARFAALGGRLSALRGAVAALPEAAQALQTTFDRYTEVGPTNPAFREALGHLDGLMAITLDSLEAAIRDRLADAGVADADRSAQERLTPVFLGDDGRAVAYNWSRLQALLQAELALVNTAVDSLSSTAGIDIEIAGFLSGKAARAAPIHLDLYNAIDDCAAAPTARHEFGLSAAQQQVFDQADSLSRTIGAARNAGDAIRTALGQQWSGLETQVRDFLGGVSQALGTLGGRIEHLGRWQDPELRRRWLASLPALLGASPSAQSSAQALDQAATLLGDLSGEIAALRALADLKDDLRGLSADRALTLIVGRVEALRALPVGGASGLLDPARWR